MTLLITTTDFATYGIILPTTLDANDLKRYINEAQEFDIKKELGEIFYYDLLTNYTQSNYQDLLNAEISYTIGSFTYQYKGGLKAALCYYTLARYLPDSKNKNTDFGLMQKKNEYSDHVSSKEMQVLVNNANSAGTGFMNGVLLYLDRMKVNYPTKFPLWRQPGTLGMIGEVMPPTTAKTKTVFTDVGNI